MKNTGIVKLVIALMLVFCSLFTMTSCLVFDIEAFYEDLLENQGGWEDNENEEEQTPNNPQQPGGSTDDEINEFYPGSGNENVDKVPALQQSLLSTVSIISNFSSPAAGSGVIYSLDKEKGDAYIITNYHVVYSQSSGICKNISVYLFGMELAGYAIPATYVGGSNNYDIAVLKITGSDVLKNSYAKTITMGDSDKLHIFDTVYAVGNPEGLGIAATRGMISVVSEQLDMEGANGNEISLRVMRIDAAVNGGNSGGGLYDDEGNLIGIVCAKRIGNDIDNIGYAIPSNLVKNIVGNIIFHCNGTTVTQLNRALMGITITAKITGIVIDPETGDISEAEIVEVTEVSAGSLAEGKIQAGDVINSITVDGKTIVVSRLHHVTDHMLNARVGSTVTLAITRGGENMDVTFVVPQSSITLTD